MCVADMGVEVLAHRLRIQQRVCLCLINIVVGINAATLEFDFKGLSLRRVPDARNVGGRNGFSVQTQIPSSYRRRFETFPRRCA